MVLDLGDTKISVAVCDCRALDGPDGTTLREAFQSVINSPACTKE